MSGLGRVVAECREGLFEDSTAALERRISLWEAKGELTAR